LPPEGKKKKWNGPIDSVMQRAVTEKGRKKEEQNCKKAKTTHAQKTATTKKKNKHICMQHS
jgi:hypothetical protein